MSVSVIKLSFYTVLHFLGKKEKGVCMARMMKNPRLLSLNTVLFLQSSALFHKVV